MTPITLSRSVFRDKVNACWLGKNIGGTLGAPYECRRHTQALEFYHPVPTESAPNDDLDLQLVWLKLLEECGIDPPLPLFAEYWSRYAASYPWNEYGFFMRNYSRGLRPPVAGCFENYFVDEMGSSIRSEIWACVHPADPQSAARMAWKDSALDHAGGEGMYGEMFWAAVESGAFVESDPITLIRIGLEMIPLSSHIARSIREAVWCYQNGLIWGEARERIASRFGHLQPCNAVPNHGFIIIGWLYGRDFGDKLCKAVNCGYDTDCTGGTLGALLGILNGTEGIPERWRGPIGDGIVVHRFTRNFTPPATVTELTDRTVALAEGGQDSIASVSVPVLFADEGAVPADTVSRLFRNELARQALAQDIHAGSEVAEGIEIRFHYHGEPVLRPGVAREVSVTLPSQPPLDRAPWASPEVDLIVPASWSVERLGPNRFRLFSELAVADRNIVVVRLPTGQSVRFAVLGPGEARGFAAGDNVRTCRKCQARVEACVCEAG
jgi:ADP-ribosylglycohydrolase